MNFVDTLMVRKKMFSNVHNLINCINDYNEIYIYGAGFYGRRTHKLLSYFGFENKIKGYLVTYKADITKENSIIEIKDYSCDDSKIVIVAVNNSLVKEIETELSKHGVVNYFNILDYLPEYEENDMDYKMSYFRRLNADKLAVQLNLNFCETGCQNYRYKKSDSRKSICIIIGAATARMVRIIESLYKKSDYRIEVIEYRRIGVDEYVDSQKLKKIGVDIKRCIVIEEVLNEAIKSDSRLYIVDSPYADASVTEIMLRNRELFGKIIFTAYDNYIGTYSNPNRRKMEAEKYCLENADGIIWRYYSKDFISRVFNVNYKGKCIHFPDCCDNQIISDCENLVEKTLHLCFVVNHAFELLENETSRFMRSAGLEEILSSIGLEAEVHIDVFVWRANRNERNIISEIEAKHETVKVFYQVPHDELMHKLKNYDYGIMLMKGSEIPQWPEHEEYGYEKIYSEGSYRYSMSNRLFEYLSVGVPIVATAPEKQCDELECGGALVKMNLDNLDIDYLKSHKKEMKHNAIKLRETYLIDNRIGELISFIESI